MWTKSPSLYTAGRPNASPPGYQSPASGDSAPIPGSQDHQDAVPPFGTASRTLSRVPSIFSAAISRSRLRREVLDDSSVSQWWGHRGLHQDEVPECRSSEKPLKASLINRTCQLTTVSRSSVSRLNLKPNKGKKPVDHATRHTPIPSRARIHAAPEGDGSTTMDDDSTSPIPSLARIPAALEGNNSTTMDDGSTPPIPSLARTSAALEGINPTMMDDDSTSPMPTIARIPATFEGNVLATMDDDTVSSVPPIARSPTAFEVNHLATTDDDPPSSLPTITRIPAAFEGNNLTRMDDKSVPSTPMIARTPAAFQGNNVVRMDNSSVPPIPTTVRPPTTFEGNHLATTDEDSTSSILAIARIPAAFERMDDSSVSPIPMMVRSPTPLEGNRPATTDDDSKSSPPTIARIPAAFEGDKLARMDVVFEPFMPMMTQSLTAFEGRLDDGFPNSLKLSIMGNITKKRSKKLTLPTDMSYARYSCVRNYHPQCLVGRNSPASTIQMLVSLEEFPPCQRPNHQPPPFRPGGRWQSSPPPHLISSTAPSAGGDDLSHRPHQRPNRQSSPFKPGDCWQSSPLPQLTCSTAPSAEGDDLSRRPHQRSYHQSSASKSNDYWQTSPTSHLTNPTTFSTGDDNLSHRFSDVSNSTKNRLVTSPTTRRTKGEGVTTTNEHSPNVTASVSGNLLPLPSSVLPRPYSMADSNPAGIPRDPTTSRSANQTSLPSRDSTKTTAAHKSANHPKTIASRGMTREPSAVSANQLAASGAATRHKIMSNKIRAYSSSQIERKHESEMATVERKVSTESHAVFWDIENVLPINHSFMPVSGLVLNISHSLENMTLEETPPNHTTSQNARRMHRSREDMTITTAAHKSANDPETITSGSMTWEPSAVSADQLATSGAATTWEPSTVSMDQLAASGVTTTWEPSAVSKDQLAASGATTTWEPSAVSADQLTASGATTRRKIMGNKTRAYLSSRIEGEDESEIATVEHEVLTESHADFWDIGNVFPVNYSSMPVSGLALMNSPSLDSMVLEGTLSSFATSQNLRRMPRSSADATIAPAAHKSANYLETTIPKKTAWKSYPVNDDWLATSGATTRSRVLNDQTQTSWSSQIEEGKFWDFGVVKGPLTGIESIAILTDRISEVFDLTFDKNVLVLKKSLLFGRTEESRWEHLVRYTDLDVFYEVKWNPHSEMPQIVIPVNRVLQVPTKFFYNRLWRRLIWTQRAHRALQHDTTRTSKHLTQVHETESDRVKTLRKEVSFKGSSHTDDGPTPLTDTIILSLPPIDSSTPARSSFYPAASISANRTHAPCKSADKIPAAQLGANNPEPNKTVRKTSVADLSPFIAMARLTRSESTSRSEVVIKDKDLHETPPQLESLDKESPPLSTESKASFEHDKLPEAAQAIPLMERVLQVLTDSFHKRKRDRILANRDFTLRQSLISHSSQTEILSTYHLPQQGLRVSFECFIEKLWIRKENYDQTLEGFTEIAAYLRDQAYKSYQTPEGRTGHHLQILHCNWPERTNGKTQTLRHAQGRTRRKRFSHFPTSLRIYSKAPIKPDRTMFQAKTTSVRTSKYQPSLSHLFKGAIIVVLKGPLTPTTGPNLARDPAANKGQSIRVAEEPLTPYSASILVLKNYTVQWLPETGRIDKPAIRTHSNKITVIKIHGLIMFIMITPSDYSRQPVAFNMRKLSHLTYPTYSDNMTTGIQFSFLDEEHVQDRTYSFNKKASYPTKLVLQLVANQTRKKLPTSWRQAKYNKKPAPCYSDNHLRAMYTTKVETSSTEVKLGTYTRANCCNKSPWSGGPKTTTRKEFSHGKTMNGATFEQDHSNVRLEPPREECIRFSPRHFHWDYPSLGKRNVTQDVVHKIQEELNLDEDEEETFAAIERDGTTTKMYEVIDQAESLQDATSHRLQALRRDERRIRSHGERKDKELTLPIEVSERSRTKTTEQVGDSRSTSRLSVARSTSGHSEVAMWQFGRVVSTASAQNVDSGFEIIVAYMTPFFIHSKAAARAKPKGSAKQHLKTVTLDNTCTQPRSDIIGTENRIDFVIPITNVISHLRHVLVGEVAGYLYHDFGYLHVAGVITDKPRYKEHLRDQDVATAQYTSEPNGRFKDSLRWGSETAVIAKNLLDGNKDKLINLDPERPGEYQERITEVSCRNAAAFDVNNRLGLIKARIQTPLLPNVQSISLDPTREAPLTKHEAIDQQLETRFKAETVKPSDSPQGSLGNIYCNAEPRIITGYRNFNFQTTSNRSSLCCQLEIIQALSRAQVSFFVNPAGFTQLKITGDAEEKVIFRCHGSELWQIKGMIFGLRNELTVFQKSIPEASTPSLWLFMFDLVIYSSGEEGRLICSDKVSRAVAALGISSWSPMKYHEGYSSTLALGQKVLQLEPLTHNEKAQSNMDLIRPTLTVIELMKSFELVTYFSDYRPSYTMIAAPLTNLLNRGVKRPWCADPEIAFEQTEEARANASWTSLGLVMTNKSYGIYINILNLALSSSLRRDQATQVKDLETPPSHIGPETVWKTGNKVSQLVVKPYQKQYREVNQLDEREAIPDETIRHIGVTAPWSKPFKSAEFDYSAIEPETPVAKVLVPFQSSIEGEETTLSTDHAALGRARVHENVNRRLVAWGAVFIVHPDLGIAHQSDQSLYIVNSLSRLIQIPPQDSSLIKDSVPTRQDIVRHNTTKKAQNRILRATITPKVTHCAMCWKDIIDRLDLNVSDKRQLAAEVKREDSPDMAKVVDEFSHSSRIESLINSEAQGNALLLSKTDSWTYLSGIKLWVTPLKEDWARQSESLITLDRTMCKEFVENHKMNKFLPSRSYVKAQSVEKLIIFASLFQGRHDGLPVTLVHHLDGWKTQLCTPKSKVNPVLRWIYKTESTHAEPRRYSVARPRGLFLRSTRNKDNRVSSFTCDAYRKIKMDNRVRTNALLRPMRLSLRLSLPTVSLDKPTGQPNSGEHWYTTILIIGVNLSKPTNIRSADSPFSTVNTHDSYTKWQLRINQKRVKGSNPLCKVHYTSHPSKSLRSTLWSKTIRPTLPTSENLNVSQRYELYPLVVNQATEVQGDVRSEQVHVSRLPSTRLWAPDSPKAGVRKTDDDHSGARLNGLEGCQVRCYWKESFPCFIVHETNSLERDQHAAPEIIIDFTTRINASSNGRNIHNYDTSTKSQGDSLSLPELMVLPDPDGKPDSRSSKEALERSESVSNFNLHRQLHPVGAYLDPAGKRHIGTETPFFSMGEPPFPDRLPRSALDNNEKADDSAKSATNDPAARTSELEPAAASVTGRPENSIFEPAMDYVESLAVSKNRDKPVEEASLDREGAKDGPMTHNHDNASPLEFTSCLMLYETSALKEFVHVSTTITAGVNGLRLVTKRMSRASGNQNQNPWFGRKSTERVWLMKAYIFHHKENGQSIHLWPSPFHSTPVSRAPIVTYPTLKLIRQGHRQSRDSFRTYPSLEHYQCARLQYLQHPHTLSPYGRSQSPCHHTVLPRFQYRCMHHSTPPKRSHASHYHNFLAWLFMFPSSTSNRRPGAPPPAIPHVLATKGLPHNTPLPIGANMWNIWSLLSDTQYPVWIRENPMVLSSPIPPNNPTLSALVMNSALNTWLALVETTLLSTTLHAFGVDVMTDPTTTSLSSRTPHRAKSPPRFPLPPADPQRPLPSQMTNILVARLNNPAQPTALASRLTNPLILSLLNELELVEQMEDISEGTTMESTQVTYPTPFGDDLIPLRETKDDDAAKGWKVIRR